MMEWSYLYLVVPPAAAVCAAVVATRVVKRSGANVDRMQAQYDVEERDRRFVQQQMATMKADVERMQAQRGVFGGGAIATATGAAYAGGSEVVHINPKDATRHG